MISLVQILREAQGNPKAIILAGAPGAGKGYTLDGLDLSGLKIMNVDNLFIEKLKKANVSLNLKRANAQQRSDAAVAMAAANKEFKGQIQTVIAGKESFILDGTAASYKNTQQLKEQLEEAGYDVFMLYVYTDLERSLKQNHFRFEKSGGKDRSLSPAVVLRTWVNVTKNYFPYKELFSNENFALVANTLEGEKMEKIEDIYKEYLDHFKVTDAKPKTPAQQARSDKQKAELNKLAQNLIQSKEVEKIVKDGLDKEEAQSKINKFLRT